MTRVGLMGSFQIILIRKLLHEVRSTFPVQLGEAVQPNSLALLFLLYFSLMQLCA